MTTLNEALTACLHVDLDDFQVLHAIGAGPRARAVLDGLMDSPLSAQIQVPDLRAPLPDTDESPLPPRDVLVLLGDARDEGVLDQLEVVAQAASVAGQTILALISGAAGTPGEGDAPALGPAGLRSLWRYVDTVLLVPESAADHTPDRPLDPGRTGLAQRTRVLLAAIRSYLFEPGLINGDFSDLRAVLSFGGTAALITADAEGTRPVRDALAKILDQPDFEPWLTETTEGLLVVIHVGLDGDLDALKGVVDELRARMPGLGAIAFATPIDLEMANACRITLLATRS
ncbi:hypothetical protein [Thiohalocapsa marina]|uniref:hypothetical protein n=1 Tax=Thiohalocapsa marina TaxID=424902 RepID=UPI0036D86ABB|nr:hypothetical protein [Sphingobacteriia bacterium]